MKRQHQWPVMAYQQYIGVSFGTLANENALRDDIKVERSYQVQDIEGQQYIKV